MQVLLVYESMFGNTRDVANAVADGLATHAHVDVTEVGEAPSLLGEDVGLLVVGAPTHGLSLSNAKSRRVAAGQAESALVSQGNGLREWIAQLRPLDTAVPVASFDTRIARPWIPGSAARAALRRLRRKGFPAALRACSFYVTATMGPLVDGERDRARRWGVELAAKGIERPL
ncbi:hypothetical protein Snas_3477 [Stackebrandtia nassauensis DSM 44728]|uniref:Flavodoxin-like domain-containing protein n=2 Tax=Stackebrandtia TaxID=283810 RepID=D3PVM7_STANL|nr:hypothetical protein Snas_3477 [Stackebrandtia nassauensis DSM 44728]